MCGIAGAIGSGFSLAAVQAMNDAQAHRGPDDSGLWSSETSPVIFGHRRLSIIDLSEAGHQPMPSADGSLWLTYNGEIYNYRELKAELSSYPFRSETDSEVVLAAYEKWGDSCVEHFNGMFAFAIWDEKRKRLFCARDRLGIKPFHYAIVNNNLLFASEIKALLAAGVSSCPDDLAWHRYLRYGLSDIDHRTFFKAAHSLNAGSTLTLDLSSKPFAWQTQTYWGTPEILDSEVELEDDDAADRLMSLLYDSVRLRLRSDVGAGVNCSGGLDSSVLLAIAARIDPEVDACTMVFNDPEGVWDLLPEAIWHQEAPLGSIETVAYQDLHRNAHDVGIKVLMEGQGADEILAGYYYYQKGLPRIGLGQDGTDRMWAEDCVSLESFAFLGTGPPEFPMPYDEVATDMQYRDLRYTKLPRVLRMNDRASMAHSVELREPYLDHRIVEFCFRLPLEQKMRDGMGKWLLRHGAKGLIPEPIRLAPKTGDCPATEWLRGPLAPMVEEIIFSKEFLERDIFDPARVKEAWGRFKTKGAPNSFPIWQWVNTELWHRQFVDSPKAALVA